MKIETPQILWHNGSQNDNGKNAPLLSCSMVESGPHRGGGDNRGEGPGMKTKCGHVLATAGNTSEINLWRVQFNDAAEDIPDEKNAVVESPAKKAKTNAGKRSSILVQPTSNGQGRYSSVEHILTLARHERSVNAVAFSPDGVHLATAGDGGSIIMWSIPASKRGAGGDARRYWSTLKKEGDLSCRVLSSQCEDVMDLSWSADSKRFVAGSLDHCVMVFEDQSYGVNHSGPNADGSEPQRVESNWRCVYRNNRDHVHYVQGVSYDPLGVYIASQGSDRTARVYSRKPPSSGGKSKKKNGVSGSSGVLKPKNAEGEATAPNTDALRQHQEVKTQQSLTESKFDLGKAKILKYRTASPAVPTPPLASNDGNSAPGGKESNDGSNHDENSPSPVDGTLKAKKHHLFADETTVESFFRRISWSADGAFLITPTALWQGGTEEDDSAGERQKSSPSFATYLFARHHFDKPVKVLSGLEKPSVVVRPCPIFFQLPKPAVASTKENIPEASKKPRGGTLDEQPYRSVFAVLTVDSIIIYDTYHSHPLCIARGLHYSGLTDCTWSNDGRNLLVTSTDGYISVLSFAHGELGDVYTPPKTALPAMQSSTTESASGTPVAPIVRPKDSLSLSADDKLLPPCEPGQMATIDEPPAKRAKKTRVAPTFVSSLPSQQSSTSSGNAAGASAISTKAKEKKRITPMLVSAETSLNSPSRDLAAVKDVQMSGTKRAAVEDASSSNKKAGNESEVVGGVTKLSLGDQPKKKKRIQPTLVSVGP